MIESFFQSLSDHGVESLLISGQAAVLYGAATFSEDIDLWIHANPSNRAQFLGALRACGAQYYKLTPPFEVEYLRRGHGFHFVLPGRHGPDVYLDVMGQPPRVGEFTEARSRANRMETDWGGILTIGIKELVELKKTQRLQDYPIVSRLALLWHEQTGRVPAMDDYRWSLENIFTLPELESLVADFKMARAHLPPDAPRALQDFVDAVSQGRDLSHEVTAAVEDWMLKRMQEFQGADRLYWRDIIAELRHIRAEHKLMVEGASV